MTYYLEPKTNAMWFYLKVKQFAIGEGLEYGLMHAFHALWINCDEEGLQRLAMFLASEMRAEPLRYDVYDGNGNSIVSHLIERA